MRPYVISLRLFCGIISLDMNAIVSVVEASCIALVVVDASKETLADEPRCVNEVPVFLFALALVGERGVRDGGIVQRRFVGDGVCVDGGEFVLLIGTKDVTKQTIVVSSVL